MSEAEEFLKDKINIPESDSPTWVLLEDCADYMEAYSEETLKALTKEVEELEITKEEARESPEVVNGFNIAVDKFLNLINNHLDNE